MTRRLLLGPKGRLLFWALLVGATMAAAFYYQNRLTQIEKRYGYFAAMRFRYLYKMIDSVKKADVRKKLEAVNDFWNGVPYASDMKVWHKKDYWATPFEFLIKDRGDCEDYVIAKYFTLRSLGIPASKLYFVYSRVRGYNLPHMVLAYYPTPKSQPLILDSLNLKIFPASKRRDLYPVYTFNGDLLQRYDSRSSRGLAGKGRLVRRKWEDLLHRMKGHPL